MKSTNDHWYIFTVLVRSINLLMDHFKLLLSVFSFISHNLSVDYWQMGLIWLICSGLTSFVKKRMDKWNFILFINKAFLMLQQIKHWSRDFYHTNMLYVIMQDNILIFTHSFWETIFTPILLLLDFLLLPMI